MRAVRIAALVVLLAVSLVGQSGVSSAPVQTSQSTESLNGISGCYLTISTPVRTSWGSLQATGTASCPTSENRTLLVLIYQYFGVGVVGSAAHGGTRTGYWARAECSLYGSGPYQYRAAAQISSGGQYRTVYSAYVWHAGSCA